MRAMGWAAAIGAVALAGAADAQERSFETSAVIPAPAPVVWEALTTAAGWKRMGVPVVVGMDFRLGGLIETSYDPKAKAGDPGNIRNQVAAYIPGRMLALRNTQAPPDFPYPREFATTATVFEITPVDAGSTRVTATGVGYGQGPAYDWLLKAFEEGDAWSLAKLGESFGAKPPAAEVEAVTKTFKK
ncbi:MAG: SRPBCC domain-containing protein [Phenylobacterium sp.]